eukprot:CAMPEP_0175509002 /NCGR_PEP_ID=MMETSP0096-20121207/10656_1 /TAXON_ID=311494 /ORGANISM="Alexandrium monilatum, Strain CCMP3105" /LENGTH=726 /DNA_ID=CAMNT_0016811149 /DNA_START=44 /DNA_END=2225 /DNA_ORIENTATION=-
MPGMPLKGVELEVTDGITEHSSRVALKGVFQNFGDVVACWVPPIDRRGVDRASVRFGNAASAEAAKTACDAGQVFLQGLPVKVNWRTGGGRRVGNSDLGEVAGGNSPERTKPRALMDSAGTQCAGEAALASGAALAGGALTAAGAPAAAAARETDATGAQPLEGQRRVATFGGARFAAGVRTPARAVAAASGALASAAACASARGVSGIAPAGMVAPPPSSLGGTGPAPQPEMAAHAAMAAAAVVVDPETEARRQRELAAARAERAKQLKRGPGVAALVQGALKRAQTQPTVAKKPENEKADEDKAQEKATEVESDEESEETLRKHREEMARAEAERRREKEKREAAEREKAEREARERREQAKREAEQAEKALQKKEAETREQRIKASVEAAKKQQAERAAAKAAKEAAAAVDSLYANMPQPNLESEAVLNEARMKEAVVREKANNLTNLPPEDRSKVVFLDVDGVLRPARAGGFDILSVDGDAAVRVDTSDFFPSAVKALRHIIERTGAIVVLSSEWRRSETLLLALTDIFEKNRMRVWGSATTTGLELETGPDPVKCFAERRAREVTKWLLDHEGEVSGWVVLDDINLAIADEARKASTKQMGPRLVQTWPLCGLTMGNAKTAVRILNGEMINKVVVERPVAPGGGLSTPMPRAAPGPATTPGSAPAAPAPAAGTTVSGIRPQLEARAGEGTRRWFWPYLGWAAAAEGLPACLCTRLCAYLLA